MIAIMRKAYRGLLFSVLVGLAGVAVAVIPALFIQSVFIGSAQRCQDLINFELAAYDVVSTNCAESLLDIPLWLPYWILIGAGLMGALGGLIYGIIDPKGYKRTQEPPWLPF